MLEPEIETLPWAEQLALDDASYRTQLAYLFERSAFYREKLTAAGCASAEQAGGLDEIAELPLTDKRELRATCTDAQPIGTHLCASLTEIVRIYSTSGTTGTPSYVPLTAEDLANWVTGSARATRRPESPPVSASSRRTTRGRSSRELRSRRSIGSGSCTFRSRPGTRLA